MQVIKAYNERLWGKKQKVNTARVLCSFSVRFSSVAAKRAGVVWLVNTINTMDSIPFVQKKRLIKSWNKAIISADPRKFFNHWLKDVQNPKSKNRHPVDPDLTVDDLLELFEKQNYRCAKTRIKLTHLKGQRKVNTNISIDRINNDLKFYTKTNIQLVCYRYNLMKGDMSEKELANWCNLILFSSHD